MYSNILWQYFRHPHHPAPYCFHSAAGQRSRLWGKHGDHLLITVLADQKIKIPAWYGLEGEAVLLFDSYFTFESKLGWHRLFLTVESTREIRTLVVVFELLEEMVAWGCRNDRFNEQFQILPLELNVKFIWMLSYVFLTVLDLPARFISVTLHVDKSLKMAAKLGDCRKLGKFTE